MTIKNPILRGFNPDPSIWRVGEDYYIATSTFEWYPGVQIHHSRDLQNWALVSRPLDRASQLDMRGNPDSCGVWAPSLSHADGLFWLVYTDMKRYDGNYKDSLNYVVTAPSIEGPWSDPIYLNSSGFDPSLFHDDDGRKWVLNMMWDHEGNRELGRRSKPGFFAGILMQELDLEQGRLVGPVRNIYQGSPHGLVEGPHLMKRDGWYYLITAEGGTGYDHAVTYARSKSIEGPYETHPDRHVLSTKDAPESFLQRVGHGQPVETPDGQFFHTFLCSRPLPGIRRSVCGRETGIARIELREDGWFYPVNGTLVPPVELEPALPAADGNETEDITYRFDGGPLPADFQWLRSPQPERLFSLEARPGSLRLFGREAIGSWFEQALIARRQTAWTYSAETVVEFQPETRQQLAGLTAYYNRHQFHYLCITQDFDGNRVLDIQSCPGNWPEAHLSFPLAEAHVLPAEGPVWMGVDVDGAVLQFRFAVEEGQWQTIGPELDASVLSDEGGRGEHANFTGAFVGMAAQDLGGTAMPADFAHFIYRNRS